MKRSILPVSLMLWTSAAALGQTQPPPPPGRGGLIDSVTRNYGARAEPSDNREKQGRDTPDAAGAPNIPATPTDRAATESLDAHIETTEKFIAERRREIEALNGISPPVETVDTLKRRLASLQERSDTMGDDYVNADRRAAIAMVEKVHRFEADFAPDVEALRKGEKPANVSAADWAEKMDRFQAGQGRLNRELQDLRRRLSFERMEAMRAVESAINELQRQLDSLENAKLEVRRRLTRREAEIAVDLAERRLAELRQMRQEYQGQPSDRRNETTGTVPLPDLPPRGGGLAAKIEGIADQLKAHGLVPEVGGRPGDPAGVAARGTPGAENLDRGDLLRGQARQLANDLRNYHDQVAAVRSQVLGEEEDEVNALRSIEAAKRPVSPFHPSNAQLDEFNRQSEAHRQHLQEVVTGLRTEQEKIREEMINRRTAFLTGQIARTRTRLEETVKELDSLPKTPAP